MRSSRGPGRCSRARRPWSRSLVLATRLGSEFIPSLNEGDLAVSAQRIPGTSLTQSVAMQQSIEKTLKARFPEIDRVFARTGTAEIAADPMPPNLSDGYIMLKPADQWPDPRKSRDALRGEIEAVLAQLPGNAYEFSQPIQLRFNELISGVRSDVAVKIFGDDMAALNATGEQIAAALQKVPGASEVKVEQTTGLPVLTVNLDRDKLARYGVTVGDVQDTVAAAVGGRKAGLLFQGDRRFDIVVRLPDELRTDVEAIKRLPIALPWPRRRARAARSRRRRTCCSPSSRRWTHRPGRTRSAARTASAASSSARTCAGATSARSSPTRASGSPRTSGCPPATGCRGAASSNSCKARASG